MKPLLAFADRHPLATGTFGTMSGVFAACMHALHVAAGVAADVAILLSCLASYLTVRILWRRWNRNQIERRRHLEDEDLDSHLDDLMP